MFKRLRWFALGAVTGALGAAYSYVRVRELRGKVAADRMAGTVVEVARNVGGALRDAVAEGRAAMAEAETQIKAELDGRGWRSSRAM
ncbi:MAG: hypothetical protein N2037_04960 [Acidimicrobiales bacterium]|nr:hypothetical protein [Acidimicrobiales bacterium]